MTKHQSIAQGATYLLVAQISFVLSGYVIHVGLGRYLGPEMYGIYAIVISIATIFNLILTTGLPNATSKYVSELNHDTRQRSIVKTSFLLSLFIGLFCSFTIFISAETMAEQLNDPTLALYIKLISLMMPLHAIFAIIKGYYNGIMDYKIQSYLILFYEIIKPALIFLLVFAGFSVFGAILGFVISPMMPLIFGLYLIGLTSIIKSGSYPPMKLLQFAVPIIAFSAVINLIMTLDLFFVKRILIDNELVGLYSAASMISRVPYFLMSALTLALFPAISANAHNQMKMQKYISEALRYALFFILPTTAMIAASSTTLVSWLYSSAYQPAGESLRILTIGLCFLSIFAVLTTIISGTGNPKISMYLSVVVLVSDFLLNTIMVPIWKMLGAAVATTFSCLIGVLFAALYVNKKYNTLTSMSSTMKIIIASASIFGINVYLNFEGIYLLIGYVISGIIYVGLLLFFGEIGEKDIRRLKKLFKSG